MAKKPVRPADVEGEREYRRVQYEVKIKNANLTKPQIALLEAKLQELFQQETQEFSPEATIVIQPKIPLRFFTK